MDSIVEKGFLQIGDIVSSLNVLQKKSLCLWLRDLPPDQGRKYSVRKILSLMKISRASYYAILKNGTYGQSVVQRNAQDEQDAELIRTVMEYKGFAKGSRQIYMMMPALTGKRMGLKKDTPYYENVQPHIVDSEGSAFQAHGWSGTEKNVRPNLLQRRFRLYRPNEVRLTDVTHLLYGDGCKAYGSALLDPVTSKLVAFLVSEHNDLELALATLRQSDLHPCVSGGLYHSDQGTVYLSGAFQQEVSKRGYTQSMSKRGNCQDNAPQESFFGHFKDECPYSECKDIEELRELVARYAEYYNYERRMWDKGRMTPVEYEQYLLAMNEAEFSLYIAKEEEKYQQMKEKAAQRAIERAKI